MLACFEYLVRCGDLTYTDNEIANFVSLEELKLQHKQSNKILLSKYFPVSYLLRCLLYIINMFSNNKDSNEKAVKEGKNEHNTVGSAKNNQKKKDTTEVEDSTSSATAGSDSSNSERHLRVLDFTVRQIQILEQNIYPLLL